MNQAYLWIILSLVWISRVCAESPQLIKNQHFDHLTSAQGLSQNSISAMIQDQNGFLWIGTQDGLNRYDGYTFTVYRKELNNPNSLSDNHIRFITTDSKHNLWVATNYGGINRIDLTTDQITQFTSSHSTYKISSNTTWAIYEDHTGHVWFGTQNGLDIYDPVSERVTHKNITSTQKQTSAKSVLVIIEDRENTIWLGTVFGLFSYDRERDIFQKYKLTNTIVWGLLEDTQHNIWCGTENGLFIRNSLSATFIPVSQYDPACQVLDQESITAIAQDSLNNLYIGTWESGLYYYQPNLHKLTQYKKINFQSQSLSENKVNSLYIDNSRNIWIGTMNRGISILKFNHRNFTNYQHSPLDLNSLSDNNVFGICEDSRGYLWVGTNGYGLNRIDLHSGTYMHYTTDFNDPHSLSDNHIWSIFEDSQGVIWIATANGLNRYNPTKDNFECSYHESGNRYSLSDNHIWSIYEDAEHDLWLMTLQGITHWQRRENRLTSYLNSYDPKTPEALKQNSFRRMMIDSRGDSWFGTDLGLIAFDYKTYRYRRYSNIPGDTTSLSNNLVRYIYEDSKQRFWVGTNDGLNCFDREKETFKIYTIKNGLPNNVIYSIIEDDSGRLWLSTNSGISSFEPDSNYFTNYDIYNGLPEMEFNQASCFKGHKGNFYFGSMNGLTSFYPDSLMRSSYVPPIQITAFKMFDEIVKFDKPMWEVEKIELSYSSNFIAFEFSALDFSAPSKNQYAYRLVNFDNQWRKSGTRHYASYTNLNAGTYTFEVIGSNADGIWNPHPARIELIIVPPFWKRKDIQLAFMLFVSLLAGLIIYRRFVAIKKNKQELEKLVAQKTYQLQEKTNLLQEIHHFVSQMNNELSFDNLLQFIFKHIEHLLVIDLIIAVVEPDEKKRYLARMYAHNSLFKPVRVDRSWIGTLIPENNIQLKKNYYSNLASAECWQPLELPEKECPQAYIIMPICAENHLHGYLIFGRQARNGSFTPQEIDIFDSLQENILSAFIKAKMLDELLQLVKQKNAILGITAHDLRNPLSGIIGYIRLIKQSFEGTYQDSKIQKNLEQVLNVGNRMLRLINDLTDISAIEAGKMTIQIQHESLLPILKEITELYTPLANNKQIHFQLQIPELLPELWIDRNRIEQVIDNIISNAIKFTYPQGQITLFCKQDKQEIIIGVTDNGQGISIDEQQYLFQSFKKLSSKPTEGEASNGLGLAICKRIIELHKGEIHVQSQKGVGSTFEVILPIDKISTLQEETHATERTEL